MCKSYEHEQLSKEECSECYQQYVASNDQYPLVFAKIYTPVSFIIGICLIILQSVAIHYKAPFYYVGSGIWAGFIVVIAQLLGFKFLFDRNMKTEKIWKLASFLTSISTSVVTVLANIGARESDDTRDQGILYTMFALALVYKLMTLVKTILSMVKERKAYKSYYYSKKGNVNEGS